MVLLVTILSITAVSAADDYTNSTTGDSSLESTTQTKSVTNIESNSIENKVSNEYETITNANSSTSKTITKQDMTNETTKTATSQKHNLIITLPDFTATSASKKTIKATIKYDDGSLADGQKAVFKLNGNTIGTTTVSKGVASISYVVPAKAAKYSLVLQVSKSTVSNSKKATSTLKVNKRTPNIATDKLFFVKSGNYVTLKASLYNTGAATATGKITFKVDGKTVGSAKLVDGSATYRYRSKGLKKGFHTITIAYGGSSALKAKKINTSLRVQKDLVSSFTYSQVLEKANKTYDYILKNKRLPNYATIEGNQLSMPDYLYLLVQAITYNNSYHNGGFSKLSTNTKTSSYDVQVSQSDYLKLAKKILSNYIVNGRPQGTIKTSSGLKLSYEDTVYMYTKIVNFVYKNKRLPNYSTVTKIGEQSDSSSGSGSSGSGSSGSGSSSSSNKTSNYTPTNKVPSGFEKYVASAKNAYVNSTTLKKAVKEAVSGVKSTLSQAKAIFKYVNDKTDYSSYSNTRYGALNTLAYGRGNCVDQSHLLLGMLRTARIPARYCHAKCYFRSGLVVGHVWVETYVNGKWYKCDTTSNQNTFNNIVNWYSSGPVSKYTELYF